MAAGQTPSQTVGPYFSLGLFGRQANELSASGTPGAVRVSGRVLDGAGEPVPDAMVEVWQADEEGRYRGDFGWGRSGCDAEGRFSFVTVKPGQGRRRFRRVASSAPDGDGVRPRIAEAGADPDVLSGRGRGQCRRPRALRRRRRLLPRRSSRPTTGSSSTFDSRARTRPSSSRSDVFDRIFVPAQFRDALSDDAWLQAMLDVERALAAAQSRAGVIPADAARAIAEACSADRFDPDAIGDAGRSAGNPVEPLVRALTDAVEGEAAGYVHWGATSQDILDTASMLISRRALELVVEALGSVATECAGLAEAHRSTPMAGRTLLQQAVPTTFGLKAAGWLAGVLEARGALARSGRSGWPSSWAARPARSRRSVRRGPRWSDFSRRSSGCASRLLRGTRTVFGSRSWEQRLPSLPGRLRRSPWTWAS